MCVPVQLCCHWNHFLQTPGLGKCTYIFNIIIVKVILAIRMLVVTKCSKYWPSCKQCVKTQPLINFEMLGLELAVC